MLHPLHSQAPRRWRTLCAALALAPTLAWAGATMALADAYPLSGKFVYERPGLAPDACGEPFMEFRGDRRHDSGGSVHDYVNGSVTRAGDGSFNVVDVFSNGQVRNGNVKYTLRLIDSNHAEIRLLASGQQIKLRRCP